MKTNRIKSLEHIAELDFKLTHNLNQGQISALAENGKVTLNNFPLTNTKIATGYKNVKFFIDNELIKSSVSTSFSIDIPSNKIKVGESINIKACIYDKNVSLSNDVLSDDIFNGFNDSNYVEELAITEVETPSIYQYSIDITNNLTQANLNNLISIFNEESIAGEKIVLKNLQLSKFGDIFNANMNNFRFIIDNKPIKHYYTKKQGIDLIILEIPYSRLKPSKIEARLFVYDKNTTITMDTSIFTQFHDPVSAVPTGVSGGSRVADNGEQVMTITSTNVQNWATGTDKYKDILSVQKRNSTTCIDTFTSGTQSLTAQNEWVLVKTNPDSDVNNRTREHSKYTEVLNKFTVRRFLISNDSNYKAFYYPDIFNNQKHYGYLENITYGNVTNDSKTGSATSDITNTALQIVMKNPIQTTLNTEFVDKNYKLITPPIKRIKATIKNTLGFNALTKYLDKAYDLKAVGEKVILENFDVSDYTDLFNENYNNIDFSILNGKKIRHYFINKEGIKKFVIEIPYNEINVGNTKIQINIYDKNTKILNNPEIFEYIHENPSNNFIKVGDHDYSDIITIENLTGNNNYFKSIINESQQDTSYRIDDPITKIGKLNTINGIWKYSGDEDVFSTLQDSTLTYTQVFNNFYMSRLLQKNQIVYFANYLNDKTNRGYSLEDGWKKQPYLHYQGNFEIAFVASMKNIIQSQNSNIQFSDENYREMIIVENQKKVYFDIVYDLEQEDINKMKDYFIYEGLNGERITLNNFPFDKYSEYLRTDRRNVKFFLGNNDLKRDVSGGKFRIFIQKDDITPKRLVITCVIFEKDYSFDFDDLSDINKPVNQPINININNLNLKPKNLLPNTICNSESLKITSDWSIIQDNAYLNKNNYIVTKKDNDEYVFDINNPKNDDLHLSLFDEEANRDGLSFTTTHYLPVNSNEQYTFSLDTKIKSNSSISIHEYNNLKTRVNSTTKNLNETQDYERSFITINTTPNAKYVSFELIIKQNQGKSQIRHITFNKGNNNKYYKSNIHDNGFKYSTMFYQLGNQDRKNWNNIINLTKGSSRTADVKLEKDERSQIAILGGYDFKIPDDARITHSMINNKTLASKEDSIKTSKYGLYEYNIDTELLDLTDVDDGFNQYKQNYLTKTTYEVISFKDTELFKNKDLALGFNVNNTNDDEVKVNIGLLGIRIWYDQKGEDYVSNLLDFTNFSKYRLIIGQNIDTSDRNIYFTNENGEFINTLREITKEEISGNKLYLNVNNLTSNETFDIIFKESNFVNNPYQNVAMAVFTDGNYSEIELPPTIFITPRKPENRYIEREDPDEGIPEVTEQQTDLDISKFTQEATPTEITSSTIKFIVNGNGTSLTGAKVDFGSNLTKYTDSEGECTFNNVKFGIYDFRVSRAGFFTKTIRNVVIDSKNTKIPVTLDPKSYTLDLNIESESNKIDNAKIELGNQTVYTDSNGYYRFEQLPAGIYEIKIEKNGYLTRFLEHNLTKSVILNIELNAGNMYDLTFNIMDEANNKPLENVRISFGDYVGYTNNNGQCIIQQVNPMDSYVINITKEDYIPLQEIIRFNSNKTFNFIIERENKNIVWKKPSEVLNSGEELIGIKLIASAIPYVEIQFTGTDWGEQGETGSNGKKFWIRAGNCPGNESSFDPGLQIDVGETYMCNIGKLTEIYNNNKTIADEYLRFAVGANKNLLASYDFKDAKSKGSTNSLIKDSGLKGNDATMSNFVDASWQSDGSLKFNGTNTVITSNVTQADIFNGSEGGTIETILKFGTIANYKGVAGDHNNLVFMQSENGYVRYVCWYDGNVYGIQSNLGINNAVYEHYIMTYDRNTIKFYINGVLKQSANIGAKNFTNNKLIIGRANNISDRYIDGSMKLFNTYNKALTQQEITDNYNKYVQEGRL